MQTVRGHERPDSADSQIFLLYQLAELCHTSSLLPAPHVRVNSLSISTAGLSLFVRHITGM